MNFSFIIPVYNGCPYLSACIQSILDANIPSSELLLIDDGSTDGSGALCEELAHRYPSIRVFHQENAGVSAARNKGLSEASGRYILFVDGDDTLDGPLLNEILSDPFLPEADLTIYGMTFDYYHNGICYRQEPCCPPSYSLLPPSQWARLLPDLFRLNALSPVWNKVYKREIILKNQLQFNGRLFLYEDLDFVLRYLACCQNIRTVSLPVYRYRQTEAEGNLRRRLMRISSIPEYLSPIEASLRLLVQKNAAISLSSGEAVLQQLHQILAREKMAESSHAEIRRICCEYAAWEAENISHPLRSRFRNALAGKRACILWLQSRCKWLRHRLAVFIKAHLHERKLYGH